jgi:uncharacterized protein (UPF0210 family)
MKIRSITSFYHPGGPRAEKTLEKIAGFSSVAQRRFQDAGYEVETTRLATTPFPKALDVLTVDAAVDYAKKLQGQAQAHSFGYLSLGPALAGFPESYDLILPMLAATKSVFLTAEIANKTDGVMLKNVKACAKIIHEAAEVTSDGFTNLRFCALANVAPYSPFFPAAYAAENQPGFALAIEAADLALGIFQSSRSLESARNRLVRSLEAQARALAVIGEDLAHSFKIKFKGIDISLAPFPQVWCSLGAALEKLGPVKLGLSGSLAAAAFLADTLDRGQWKRAGFNGVMLPVLEDSTLADRAAGGTLTLKDLLLYSTVCGTGLDTVPLPGDASVEQLAAVLVDVAALSMRLNKPLTARLMPIPGMKAGDVIHFDFDYFADGKVMDLPALPLRGLLAGDENFILNPRDIRI